MFMGMYKKTIIFYISGRVKLETDFFVESKNEKHQDF